MALQCNSHIPTHHMHISDNVHQNLTTGKSPWTSISNCVMVEQNFSYLGFRKLVTSKCTQDVFSANFLSDIRGMNFKGFMG